jgi:arylsulfatase
MAGWSLYLDANGAPTYHYNWSGHEYTSVCSPQVLEPGHHVVRVIFDYDGGFGAGGEVLLDVDSVEIATGRIDRTVPLVFSMSGETFDIGVDTGSPVGPYPHQFECTADIIGVTIERLDRPAAETEAAVRRGMFRASLSAQ